MDSRAWLLALLSAVLATAQVNHASLAGTVSDETGAVLQRAEVTVFDPSTGSKRTTHTNALGRYAFTRLLPGTYQVTAQQEGFNTSVQKGVSLAVGADATLDIKLAIGTITTETVVTADAAMIETRATGLSSTMDMRSIRELPLNGRDFAQLALLEPGVAPSRRTSDSGGPGTKLILNGGRPSQVSFVLDGADINDANNNTPGSAAGVLLGVDTLQEFRVLTSAYSAAYGRSGGGVITAVTKSGNNDWHGSLFEFVRNSAFDARNFFDAPSAPMPPFRRNQFGGSLSGPIRKDRTFFFGSYEGLRQRLGVTSRSVVPDSNARIGIIPGRASVVVDPSVPAYLNLIPLPNDRNFGDGTGEYVSAASNATNQNFITGRLDHRFSERLSAFVRFTRDKALVGVPDALRFTRAETASDNRYLTTELTQVMDERTLNTSRFSFNTSFAGNNNIYLTEPAANLSFLPGSPFGQISVTGLFSLGPSRFGPQYSDQDLYQFSDDFSRVMGRHTLRAGADYRFYLLATSRPQSPYGFYQFNGLVDLLQARPASVELTLPGSQLDRNWRQSMIAAYAEDTMQLTRRLTLNLGLRYERTSVPVERDGLSSMIRDPLRDSVGTIGPLYRNSSAGNFAPRVGIAWDPFGDGKTSIRSGFGLFFDPMWSDFYANAGNRMAPFYTLGSIRNPVFPDAAALVNSPAFVLGRLDVLQYTPNNPYSMQYNLSLQRSLWGGALLTASYSGQRGIHLVRFIDGNQAIPQILPDGRKFFPLNSTTRNPNLTGVRYKVTDGQSWYNALQMSFEQRLRHGLQFQVNYVFARNIDDGSITVTQGGDNDLPQDPDSRKAERGLSNYDIRHYFVAHWTHEIGKGWQWNAIATMAAGNPFSVVVGFDRARARFQSGTSPQRPDLAPGSSNNPVLGGPDRYFDPAAFTLPEAGFYGNLGRNTLIGPGLANVDLSLSKRFRITERVSMQLRGEAFNVLNRANFAIPSQRTVFTSSGPSGSAGRITSTATPARQMQIALKLLF